MCSLAIATPRIPRRLSPLRTRLSVIPPSSRKNARNGGLDELPLFAVSRPVPAEPAGPSPIENAVDELKPDELSPRAALDAIYRLKALRQGGL